MDYQRFSNFSNDELSDIINDYGMAKNTNLSTDNSMRILVKYMTERSYPNLEEMGKDQIDNLLYAFLQKQELKKRIFIRKLPLMPLNMALIAIFKRFVIYLSILFICFVFFEYFVNFCP